MKVLVKSRNAKLVKEGKEIYVVTNEGKFRINHFGRQACFSQFGKQVENLRAEELEQFIKNGQNESDNNKKRLLRLEKRIKKIEEKIGIKVRK